MPHRIFPAIAPLGAPMQAVRLLPSPLHLARLSMTNTEIVNQFIESWSVRDLAHTMSFFADDAVYHNIPMPKLTGRTAIAQFIGRSFERADTVAFEILHSSENAAGTVLNERIDEFVLKDGKRISMPVMGVFEMRDGKIAAWRDYFDMKEYEAQLAA